MTEASRPDGVHPNGGIGPEYISIEDYAGLLVMLRVCFEKIDKALAPLWAGLDARFENLKYILD